MQTVEISGVVTPFQGNGRKLGYPTANLRANIELKDGVYYGYSDLAEFKDHPTLIFVGTPTTLGDKERRVEAYLIDIPDQDYYDQELKLKIVEFHRDNKTFPDVDALLEVMAEDEKSARRWFKIA